MLVIEDDTASAYSEIIERLSALDATGSRNGETREELMVCVHSSDPSERHLFREGYNLAFALQECFAYWNGLNPGHVERYNTNMETWLDEDGDLPGSAYGDRLVNTAGHNQIARAIDQLTENPETRRALMAVHQPHAEDYDGDDVACTASLQPFVRDGDLHMTATVRSQDMFWGYPYDSHNNQWLQEAMAGVLGLEVGDYWHVMRSCHYYTEYEEQALSACDAETGGSPSFDIDAETMESDMRALGVVLAAARDGAEVSRPISELFDSQPYADWADLMAGYEAVRFHDRPALAASHASRVFHDGWSEWLGDAVERHSE